MTTDGPAEPHGRLGAPERATFLELLFDLVVVVVLFQLTHTLLQHLSWVGAVQSLVLLLAAWRIWLITTWITDRLDPQQEAIQRLIIGIIIGSLVLAAALPQAFGKYGLIFAGVYVALHIGRQLFLTLFLRGGAQRVALASLVWAGVSAVPWIVGGLTHGALRLALWTVAVVLDYVVHAFDSRFPGPAICRTGSRRSRPTTWPSATGRSSSSASAR
jgi:low temperature requirement protein LtrA